MLINHWSTDSLINWPNAAVLNYKARLIIKQSIQKIISQLSTNENGHIAAAADWRSADTLTYLLSPALKVPECEKSSSMEAFLYSGEKWILFQSCSIIDGHSYI